MVTEIQRTSKCGWCIVNDHEHCNGYVKSYDTVWVCGCEGEQCGARSPRNAQRIAEKPTVPEQENGGEATVQPAGDKETSTSVTGQNGSGDSKGVSAPRRRRNSGTAKATGKARSKEN